MSLGEISNRKIKIAFVSGGNDNEYNSAFATFLSEEFKKANFHMIWYQSVFAEDYTGKPHEVGEMNIYNLINYDMIDLIVMLTITMRSEDAKKRVVSEAKKHNIPLISVDEIVEGAYNITFDYNEGIRDMICHVIDKHNAKTINFIGGIKGNPLSDAREKIYRAVLAEHNIEIDENRIGYAWFWHKSAEELFEKWHNNNLVPDAVVCANDSMAIGVCNKAAELGYNVPEELIVTGVDGISEAMTYIPAITTAKINISKASERISEVALGILNGTISPQGNEVIAAERLYSQSCGCEEISDPGVDNLIRHNLFEDVNQYKGVTKAIINIADEVVVDADFRVTVERLELFMEKVWSRSVWICVCDDFITKIDDLDEINSDYANYRKEGYSENIGYGVRYSPTEHTKEMLPVFKTAELLPNLDEIFDKYHHITVEPLHFQDRVIGYIAVEFEVCVGNFNMLNTFDSSVISLVLENARVQSELHGFANKLEEMYVRDPLTKLMNRRGFYKFAQRDFEKCRKQNKEFMIASVDLNGLKTINDSYGHADGDNAIIRAAMALEAASGGAMIVARFGGDEYVAAGMCPSEDFSDEFMQRLNGYLDDYNKTSGKPYKVAASCGIYKAVPREGSTMDEFVSEADKIMYTVKQTTKARSEARR